MLFRHKGSLGKSTLISNIKVDGTLFPKYFQDVTSYINSEYKCGMIMDFSLTC